MMKREILVASLAALGLANCSQAQTPAPAPEKTDAALELNIETLADGLRAPWSVAVLPDNTYLVTEKTGGLKHVNASGEITDIQGLPDRHVQSQGGLLDVVLSPDFSDSKIVYLSFSSGNKKANATSLFKARLEGDALVDGNVIFTASPAKDTGGHFGGRIAFMPDGTLILTLGDGFAYREEAQNKGSDLGKIVRVNPDGSIPSDNPFVNEEGAKPEIYSYGHRNVQGLHYDAQTNVLWAHEHGAKGGDELNFIKPGENYGWPLATTGVDYNGAQITPFKTYEGTEPFVKDWVPSIAPSGLTIYRGDMFPAWNGDALIGGLKSRDVRRVDLEDGKYIGEEVLLAEIDARIRDVRTAPDGAILLVTDDAIDGKVLRVTPK